MTYTCFLCGCECVENEKSLAEMRAKYGDLPPEERAVTCDDCHLWMADVERLARDLAVKDGKDPDETWLFHLEYQPAWCAYIGAASKLTSLPGPETRLDD